MLRLVYFAVPFDWSVWGGSIPVRPPPFSRLSAALKSMSCQRSRGRTIQGKSQYFPIPSKKITIPTRRIESSAPVKCGPRAITANRQATKVKIKRSRLNAVFNPEISASSAAALSSIRLAGGAGRNPSKSLELDTLIGSLSVAGLVLFKDCLVGNRDVSCVRYVMLRPCTFVPVRDLNKVATAKF